MSAASRFGIRPILRILDPLLAAVTAIISPFVYLICRAGKDTPISRATLDRAGVSIVRHHYYEPVVHAADIKKPLDAERPLPGIDLNAETQFGLVDQFQYRAELEAIPLDKPAIDQFGYVNGRYGEGDAEMFYNMIRHFKPKRIVEVGSGQSTLLALLAIAANRRDDPAYDCRVTCIEPYEQPWLESIGVDVVRQCVEDCPDDTILSLEPGDIFFIDSSHVIRPQGDVLHLFLYLLPMLRPGVLTHIHDVFVPRDYPAEWLVEDRRMWNEQYLLEAFLTFNREFEVLLAVNWLANRHRDKLQEACPMLMKKPNKQPGAFWIRRVER